jgi:DNA-binding beta-propeller fold protein YncE
LWASRYDGPAKGSDDASALAVSPSGRTVFVTGDSERRSAHEDHDYATIAYDATDGRQLWVSRYNGPGSGFDAATSAVVSPHGTTVYVTGTSTNKAGRGDFATIAYSAANGRKLWVSRSGLGDEADSVAVNPAGTMIYITGREGYATIAYRAATGKKLWTATYRVPRFEDIACCVAVNPAGKTVYVSGDSDGPTGNPHYVTIAYHA